MKAPHINQKKPQFFVSKSLKKPQITLKKPQTLENIFKVPRILKKASHSQKSHVAIAALPQWPVRP
jgi:hypothetical protein